MILTMFAPLFLNYALAPYKLYLCMKVRTGLEMALIDAVANSIDVPLWRLFGGVSNTLSTAATVKSQIQAYIYIYITLQ